MRSLLPSEGLLQRVRLHCIGRALFISDHNAGGNVAASAWRHPLLSSCSLVIRGSCRRHRRIGPSAVRRRRRTPSGRRRNIRSGFHPGTGLDCRRPTTMGLLEILQPLPDGLHNVEATGSQCRELGVSWQPAGEYSDQYCISSQLTRLDPRFADPLDPLDLREYPRQLHGGERAARGPGPMLWHAGGGVERQQLPTRPTAGCEDGHGA